MTCRLSSLLLTVLLAAPLVAESNVWTRAVDRQLDEEAEVWAADGWVEVGGRYGGSMDAEDDDFFKIRVPTGSELLILGACDQDCTDLDLWAYGEKERAIAEDEEEDDLPILEVAARDARTGTLEIQVGMVECSDDPCYWGVAILASRRAVGPGRRTDRGRPEARTILRSGELRPGDERLATGELYDEVKFPAEAGERITVELRSDEFNPYIILESPSGETFETEVEGFRHAARVRTDLDDSGNWRVLVTTEVSGERGRWELEIWRGSGSASFPGRRPRAADRSQADPGSGGPRVHALLVGISDYEGDEDDLSYTADDARRLRRALTDGAGMRPEDAILLVDREATVGAFRRAVERLAARVGPDDTFVLFFSGHGGRVERDRYQPSDPDAIDETLTFYDQDLTDDELARLLGKFRAGRTLVVLDSCFSGGFAKDIISAPGRMGLFSSEEDVVSQVAAKFRAGGYLSLFLGEGVASGYADDGDGELTALELSQYVYERYRRDVKGATKDEIVDFEDDRLGYQHLVVDRGSIAPSAELFRLRRRRGR